MNDDYNRSDKKENDNVNQYNDSSFLRMVFITLFFILFLKQTHLNLIHNSNKIQFGSYLFPYFKANFEKSILHLISFIILN